eukprot:5306862-Amphidinium_carterae.1
MFYRIRDVPKALLKSHAKTLTGRDAFWHIDVAILEAMMGSQGEGLLKERVIAKVTSHPTEPKTTLQQITAIVNSNAYKWCRGSVRTELNVAHDMFVKLTSGQPLLMGTSTATPWLTRFMVALEVYCSYQPPTPPLAAATAETDNSKQNLPPAVLTGSAALEALLESFGATAPKKLEDL